jgi:adenylate cyclase
MELRHFRREPQALEEWAEETILLSAEYGIAYFHARAISHQGWVLVEQGEVEQGIAEMRRGLDAVRATGSLMYLPMELTRMARAHAKLGQTEEGLTLLKEAQAAANRSGERYYEAEIHRLKGELLLAQGDEGEAEASLKRAVEVARQQKAKSLELRATVSLCRFWQERGRREEAGEMLAGIYGWFTEGLDTPDLQEAKALLQELS